MSHSKTALKAQAYQAILRRLLQGVYAPGDSIDRRHMATELGMSVAPVHEAMIQLEWEGLLMAIPRRGTQVRPVRQADIYGHLVLREALECQVARLVCGATVATNLATLEELARVADLAVEDQVAHGTGEVAFHCALADLTGVPLLVEQYRRIMQLGTFLRVSMLLTYSGRVSSSHRELLQVLATSDPDAAAAAARQHIWEGKPAWLRQFNPEERDHAATNG